MTSDAAPATETAPRFCGECGARLSPGDRFCGGCGAAVAAAPASPPPQARTRPPAPPEPQPTGAILAAGPDGVRATASTLAVWTVGWGLGALIGAWIFAEVLHRHVLLVGGRLPVGVAGRSLQQGVLIEGVAAGGIAWWLLSGFVGGAIAAAVSARRDRQAQAPAATRALAAAAVWAAVIALLVSVGGLILLAFAGAAIGVLYAWRRERTATPDMMPLLWSALAWFVGSIVGLALLWVYQMA